MLWKGVWLTKISTCVCWGHVYTNLKIMTEVITSNRSCVLQHCSWKCLVFYYLLHWPFDHFLPPFFANQFCLLFGLVYFIRCKCSISWWALLLAYEECLSNHSSSDCVSQWSKFLAGNTSLDLFLCLSCFSPSIYLAG